MESLVSSFIKSKYSFREHTSPQYLNSSIISKNVYTVGFIDHVENHSLIVGCNPSFTSLSIEEIDNSGRLTPLDIVTTVYESSVSSCCFNDSSSMVSVSTADNNVYLWDLHTQADLRKYQTNSMVSQLQRYIGLNNWIGKERSSIVLFDARDSSFSTLNTISDIQSFSLSQDKNIIAIASSISLSLFDPRFLQSPITSIDFPQSCTVHSIAWNSFNTLLSINCGKDGIYQWFVSSSLPSLSHLPLSNNQFPHQNAYVDDTLVVGSDIGQVNIFNTDLTLSHSFTLSKSPIYSILPLHHPNLPSSFIVSTDTEIALLSLFSTPFSYKTTLRQTEGEGEEEEEPDIIRMDEQPEAEEWMLQGVQSDYSRCSYEQYGACRQQVFVCRTCRAQYDRYLQLQHPEWYMDQIEKQYDIGYLCEQCAHFCHVLRGHDVVALGVKNHVTCDCGNMLFKRLDILTQQALNIPLEEVPSYYTCSLYPSKIPYNQGNVYSHNCRERYCYCDKEEELPMVQCVGCCDWFHNDCAVRQYALTHEGKTFDIADESLDFICEACERRGVKQDSVKESGVKESDIKEIMKEEENDDDEEELRMIKMYKEKGDRAGAMKMIMRYMLKKSLSQSESSNRSIIVENDVNKARKDIEKIVKKLKKEKYACL